jgi:hypothetical protein
MKVISRFCIVMILGASALLMSGVFSPACSRCLSAKPEAILDCLSEAYAARDTTLYRELFADDYRFFFGPDSTSWGLETDFPAMKELCRSATKLELLFPDRGTLMPGEAPNTWMLHGISSLMKFDAIKDGKPQHYEVTSKGQMLRVRRVTDPKPRIVIYNWWQPAE